MTSIITIKRAKEIILVTDGRGVQADGTTINVSKCVLLPNTPALVAARGINMLSGLIAVDAASLSFDELLDQGVGIVLNLVDDIKNRPGVSERIGKEELYFAGYSDREERLSLYMMVMDDRYASRGWAPWTFNEIEADLTAAPDPAPGHLEATGFVCPPAADFVPETHGLAVMEAQRMVPAYSGFIGNYIQASTVTRDGVSAKIVYRWPELKAGSL